MPQPTEEVVEATATAVAVRLGDAEYGLSVDDVREVLRPPVIAPLPEVPPALLGVATIRGQVVPVVDLARRLFGRPALEDGRLVVVEHPGSGEAIGLRVDAVVGLITWSGEPDRAPEEAIAGLPPGIARGVVSPEPGRAVLILDLATVLELETAEGEMA